MQKVLILKAYFKHFLFFLFGAYVAKFGEQIAIKYEIDTNK